jgi:RNA polymerase sigma-70 factor (ECF subfamily)
LAQEAFVRAYRQLGSFAGGSKFSTWLCKIVINLSLDWRRRETRRDNVHAQWAAEAFAEHAPDGGFPDELSRRVQAALDRLPAKQRAAIVLTIYENQNPGLRRSHRFVARLCRAATIETPVARPFP